VPRKQEEPISENPRPRPARNGPRRRVEVWLKIGRLTLREPILRFAGHLALLAVIAVGVWAARIGLGTLPVDADPGIEQSTEFNAPTPTPVPQVTSADLPEYIAGGLIGGGISRSVDLHTVFPSRPRLDMIQYVVQQGDTLFGIAEKFGLEPESVLWGNFDVLQDDPHRLKPGQELSIPPIDGTIYVWHEGDGLNGVADFFHVAAQEIIDWPGNQIDPSIDLANPQIDPGTMLMIPGGTREIVTWSAPRITRANPAVARVLGPGACGSIYDGPIGLGVFVWPTASTFLSGYNYSSIHPAIDIAGSTGNAIFASDNGVVVYSGWNDWGYGYVIVLDHGNGWQTLYAHLSQINVGCGQAVFQSQVIGAMGSTGNSSGSHLHFEMMHDEYGKVNPWNFLP
jgi:LysM repeat protein